MAQAGHWPTSHRLNCPLYPRKQTWSGHMHRSAPGHTSRRYRPGACLIWCAQTVADSRFGQDVFGTFRIGFHFLSQLAHIDAQILGVSMLIPELVEQEFVGQHLAGMLHQKTQEIVLFWRKPHLAFPQLDDPADQIDGEITDPEHGTLTLYLQAMTQRGPGACEQLVHAERLGDIVVGTAIERLDLADLIASARQHHDRYMFVLCPNHLEQIKPLHVRKAEIEDNQVRTLREQLQRSLSVGGVQDLIALRDQSHPEQLSNG